MTATADPFPHAVQTFMGGFTFTRSFTHPYLIERLGPTAWLMRDAPRSSGDWRTEEFVAFDMPAEEVHALARRHAKRRYAISLLLRTEQPVTLHRDAYKALGYRLGTTEAFMHHRLQRIPNHPPPRGITLERVLSQPLADRLARAARRREILPQHLTPDAPMRQYVALAGEHIVGWVRSIVVGNATWCSNMHVLASHRRQGIGRALMCRLLRDDRKHASAGGGAAVTLASHAGSQLYPTVGYQQIGTLLLFTPRK